ncbi:MAG: hypothetical protein P0Y55_09430 [Candidatus Cohnella colombiensis]|uniref:F5/8 type C domain-containing protein n=1 Tax=Candidatus Cohnella colombiensis TaxID=3121368 RepID=A0AA95JHQ9_9BACL|nr:MAG: hypothetical protein P0Y55_09430 [Cohnella sp.]
MKKNKVILISVLILILLAGSLSSFAFASNQTNIQSEDKAFTIPMNSYCDISHPTDLSINISNLSGDKANVILKLFKKDGSELTTAGSSYNGIESTIAPGTPIDIDSNGSETYHITFGGNSNSCSERPYYGSISSATDSKLIAGGWVDGSIGNVTLLINNGEPWDSGSSGIEPNPTPEPTPEPTPGPTPINTPIDACSVTDVDSLIHTMTSNTSSHGIASSSSYMTQHNAQAFYAFDNTCGNFSTALNVKTGWLQYEFFEAKTVNKYSILMKQNDPNYTYGQAPKSWQFQAYDEQTQSWVTLDTQTTKQTDWSPTSPSSYSFNNTVAYRKYRLNFTANHGGNSICVSEVGMMGY